MLLKTPPTPTWSARTFSLLFFLLALSAVALLAACDSGAPAPTPTITPDSSQASILQAAPGIPRGKAVFMRYCNACHPGGGRGSGPSLIGLAPSLSDDQIKGSVRRGMNRMPAYDESTISNEA